MNQPVIAEKKSIRITLEPGTYWWCKCGKSSKQPFCDGSHKEEGIFKPVKLELTETQEVCFCQCKHTTKEPHCDGTHKTMV